MYFNNQTGSGDGEPYTKLSKSNSSEAIGRQSNSKLTGSSTSFKRKKFNKDAQAIQRTYPLRSRAQRDYSQLPTELIQIIFSMLPAADIKTARAVCQRWWNVSQYLENRLSFVIKNQKVYPKHFYSNIILPVLSNDDIISNLKACKPNRIRSLTLSHFYLHPESISQITGLLPKLDELILCDLHLEDFEVDYTEVQRTALERITSLAICPCVTRCAPLMKFLNCFKNLKSFKFKCIRLEFFRNHLNTLFANNASTLREIFLDDLNQYETIYDYAHFDSICGIKNLKKMEINITSHSFNASLNNIFKTLKNLTYLNLPNSEITDGHIARMTVNLKFLHTLKINGCDNLTNCGLAHLAKNFTMLSVLDISSNNFTDTGFKFFKTSHRMSELNINSTLASEEMLMELIKKFPNLRVLNANADHCCLMDCKNVLKLIQTLPKLRELYLPESINFDDTFLKEKVDVVGLFSQLELLNFSGSNISDKFFAKCLKSTKLKVLNARHCINITNKGLAAIARNCPNIENLELNVDSEANIAIIKKFLKLRYFNGAIVRKLH